MNFNQHLELAGRHAFLSPSNYHWLNYDDVKLEARFYAAQAARRGSDLHAFAHEAIRLGIRLAKGEQALATYVSDALKYQMICEQTLFYSVNCFGTADTIGFSRNTLRIHDLKTGLSAVSMKQLEVYAALFCLEYGYSPFDIKMNLRIYQRDEVRVYEPEPDAILFIMDKIIEHDRQIEAIKEDRW